MIYAIYGGAVTVGLMFVVFVVPTEVKPLVVGLQLASLIAQGVSLFRYVRKDS